MDVRVPPAHQHQVLGDGSGGVEPDVYIFWVVVDWLVDEFEYDIKLDAIPRTMCQHVHRNARTVAASSLP